MEIAIGYDHAGYQLKDTVLAVLNDLGYQVVDFGLKSDEFTYTTPIAEQVSDFVVEHHTKGILICGSGVGMSIAANKHKGIRCVCCSDLYTCKTSRSHNNTNVLAFGARIIDSELAKKLVHTWLTTDFEGGKREVSYNLITQLEEQNFK